MSEEMGTTVFSHGILFSPLIRFNQKNVSLDSICIYEDITQHGSQEPFVTGTS